MVEREGVLETVCGDVAVRPEAANVVDENVQARVRGEELAGSRRTSACDDMSATKASMTPPPDSLAISAADRWVRPVSRPVIPTRAPIDARRTAVARPIPPVPPVTNTVFPAMEVVAGPAAPDLPF